MTEQQRRLPWSALLPLRGDADPSASYTQRDTSGDGTTPGPDESPTGGGRGKPGQARGGARASLVGNLGLHLERKEKGRA